MSVFIWLLTNIYRNDFFLTSFSKCGVNFIRYGESVVRCEISDQDCRETQSSQTHTERQF